MPAAHCVLGGFVVGFHLQSHSHHEGRDKCSWHVCVERGAECRERYLGVERRAVRELLILTRGPKYKCTQVMGCTNVLRFCDVFAPHLATRPAQTYGALFSRTWDDSGKDNITYL